MTESTTIPTAPTTKSRKLREELIEGTKKEANWDALAATGKLVLASGVTVGAAYLAAYAFSIGTAWWIVLGIFGIGWAIAGASYIGPSLKQLLIAL